MDFSENKPDTNNELNVFQITQNNLKQSISNIGNLLNEWYKSSIIQFDLEEYKQKVDEIISFSKKTEDELWIYFKKEIVINSEYHDEIVDTKLKNFIKHLKQEICNAVSTFKLEENYESYINLLSQLKNYNPDPNSNFYEFALTRNKLCDTLSCIEKFQDWHVPFIMRFNKFKEHISKLKFAISESTSLNNECQLKYTRFEEYCKEGISDIIASRYGLPLLYDDLLRLKPNKWLNDRIINFFNEYLTERIDKLNKYTKNSLNNDIILFKSYFFIAITSANFLNMNNYNYSRVQKYTQKYMFNNQCIFRNYWRLGYIVNLNNSHWIFVMIDNIKHHIIMYDSLRYPKQNANDEIVLKIFQRYIKDEYIDKESINEEAAQKLANEYTLHIGSCPRQQNTDDCGVYLCKNLELFSKGEDITRDSYTYDDIQYFRFKMFELIIKIGINKEGYLKFDQLI